MVERSDLPGHAAVRPINVLVTSKIPDECLQAIAAVSEAVRLTDASDTFRAESSGDPAARKELDELLSQTEVIFGLRLPPGVPTRAPRLKWVQLMSAGVDRFLTADVVESPVVLTNVSGIHATPIGEFVLALMLMLAKNAPLHFRLKEQKQWKRLPPSLLRSKTVGVVGLGSIGREVARLAKCFGMRVVATRRSAKREGRARYVDLLLPPHQLERLLKESDYVVLAAPVTSETRGLIGEGALQSMKPTAYLVNIGRGDLLDEIALVRALEEGWIAGAGLDVFATEPLPTDSKLWELPNVVISPHVAGVMEDYAQRATERFVENLERYVAGRRLLHVVNKERGY
ncbi:MAG: D-2-hydroxyacid dehydrogenase [Chloroflexota bacterium]